ncbi:hypothetical protein PGT21_005178 [Puccinia graminis f. sp. tritici]|uniref:Uncharacterized protein n=1 Tax=Puccinia graminis f. sp. tritici TaxID=56615 RepID=A0A5B0RXL2_PUCGR|nr:hypothetical protein PGT21_005178 [Puccinia graminis f. sp. tritici]KAA1129929.1 hypothetical protein PGTUg99_004883 [Puccinia graminis f. sp. tritici]
MSIFYRLAGRRSTGYLTDHPHDNPCEDDYDGKSVETSKITFGCNQQCPTVGLSPTYHRLGSKFDSNEHPHLTNSSSSFEFVPHLHNLPIGIGPQFKKKFAQMFRSKSSRGQNHSGLTSKSQPKAKPQSQTARPQTTSSSAFDEMLRSNQTIYIGGVNETTPPVSYHSREVLYSNIPLTSAQGSRPSR